MLAAIVLAGCGGGTQGSLTPATTIRAAAAVVRATSNGGRGNAALALDAGWPWTFERGPAFTGEARGNITAANLQNLAMALQTNLGSPAYYSPVIVGSTVIAASTKTVAAFDLTNGRRLWSFASPARYSLFSAPTVVDASVYVATAWKGAAVYALDLRTGTPLWSRDFGTKFAAYGAPTPVPALGLVVVGLGNQTEPPCSHGAILALSAAGGATVWEHDTATMGNGAGVWNAVNVAGDGSLLVPVGNPCNGAANTEGDSILALDPASGKERWRYTALDALRLDRRDDADYDFGATPVDAAGLVVAPSKNGIVYAVDRATASLRWQTPIAAGSSDPTRGGSISSPAWDGRFLYVGGGSATGDGTGFLNALTSSGAIAWRIASPQPVTAPPTVSNDLVFAGFGTSLVAASTASGTIVWSAAAGGLVFGGPAISGDRLCFTSEAGDLLCYRLTQPAD